MKKFLFILLFIGYETSLLPIASLANNVNAKPAEESFHHKKATSCDAQNMPCCRHPSSSKKDKKNDCGDNCGRCACYLISASVAVVIPAKQELNCDLFTSKKENNHFPEPAITPGFYSIWRPPKIG
ncbi:hypothetical protein [Parafilimonas sp.]|uniref:hypothetical protein n=1 Tax=Parafilimonas sp. TaxID=1969739 RepID=UPI0039E557D7